MSQRWFAAVLLIALSSAAGMAGGMPLALAAGPATRGFATPDDAIRALVAAMRANNTAALRNVLGPGSEQLIQSGDTVADAQARQRFLAAYDAKHAIAAGPLGRMVVTVGDDDWPLPIPIVMSGGR